MPAGSAFGQDTPVLGDDGTIAQKLIYDGSTGLSGFWIARPGAEDHVYTVPDGSVPSEAFLTRSGRLIFEVLDFGFYSHGIWSLDLATREVDELTPQSFDHFYAAPAEWDGRLGYTLKQSPDGQSVRRQSGAQTETLLSNVVLDAPSPYSWLFGAAFASDGAVALKVRYGKAGELEERRPDALLLRSPEGAWSVAVSDSDLDPASPLSSLDNSVTLLSGGRLVFSGADRRGRRGVFSWSRAEGFAVVALSEVSRDLSAMPHFYPAANESGSIAFRGLDDDGKEALYRAQDGLLVKFLVQGQAVKSDLGPAEVRAFYNGVSIAADGRIGFKALLYDASDSGDEYGLGVFTAAETEVSSGARARAAR